MKHRAFVGFMIVLFTLCAICLGYVTMAKADTSLRSLAQNRGIRIGAAVKMAALRNDPTYREVLAREFNMVTPEYVMKFKPMRPEPHRFNFKPTDEIVAFAKAHNMQVRGHTLVWHESLPEWLEKGNFTRDQLIEILREHIQTVVGHYRGQMVAWDVVNEAIMGNGLRKSIWLEKIGPEYIEMAFRWAHEADPQARLFYNDYGAEGLGKKSDAIYAFLKQMQQRGVPIHGVGLQTHVGVKSPPKPQEVAANIQRLGELGLEVHITEIDVMIQDGKGSMQERFAAQAQVYKNMLNVCLSADPCKAFVIWGFTDKYSWIPAHTKKPDAALIFDESYRPKPAYEALQAALKKS